MNRPLDPQVGNQERLFPKGQDPKSFIRSIPLDIILTIVTFGLFNLYVQHQQMRAVNVMVGQEKYRFWIWLLLVILTGGLYHIYHEYRMSVDIAHALGDPTTNEGILSVILTVFFFWVIADAIQQSNINRYFGSYAL